MIEKEKNYIDKIEELARRDERNKVYEELSKYCINENAKYGFIINGNKYIITKCGYIDNYEEAIRNDERTTLLNTLKTLRLDDMYNKVLIEKSKNKYKRKTYYFGKLEAYVDVANLLSGDDSKWFF